MRELQNEVQRALALGDGPILGAELLSPRLCQPKSTTGIPAAALAAADDESGLLRHQLERVEAQLIHAEVRGIAFTQYLSEDVVRHPLVQRIVHAYEQHGSRREG